MWLSHQQAAEVARAALARAIALTQRLSPRAVGTVGTGVGQWPLYPHLDFDRSVNPISIRGADYVHDIITTCPSVFSVLPTALSPDF